MKNIIIKMVALMVSVIVYSQHNHAINTDFMDSSVRAQDDFYNFANGGWMQKAEIPSDRSRWGSFDELREFTDSVSLNILKKSLKTKYKNGEDGQKVADLYQSITNLEYREKVGIKPLEELFSKIDKIKNLKDLQKYFIKVAPYGGNDLYGFYVYSHMKRSSENTLYLSSGGLGMGRDYYHKSDERSQKALKQYVEYIDKLKKVVGIKSKFSAEDFLNFEKQIANNLKTIVERRNSQLRYNPVALSDLDKMVKNIDLKGYLKKFKVNIDTLIIPEIEYYRNMDKIINKKNLPLIKEYLKISAANGSASLLTKELNDLKFDFYSRTLRGQKEQKSLEKRALGSINGSLGEVLGKLYVAEVFPPEAKEKAKEMIFYIKKSFAMHINNLEWMSPKTKEKALEKLSKFTVKIGYPDKWKDYSKLNITSINDGGNYFSNAMNISKWGFHKNIEKLHQPVDRSEWGMNPQTVNAYYNSSNNEIVFPAAILQPPFYNFKADAAVNFGGIGAVIGHELSHGFDDSGSQYDGDGNLNNWWTEEDHAKFKIATKALADQYSSYEPLPEVKVNGEFTLGENIADLGGVAMAYDGLLMYLKDKGTPAKIQGFSPEQRFFLSWATIWRSKYTNEALANQVKTDPHSPGYYRANGPLINQESFFKAFEVKKGDKMYKKESDRIIIW